VKNRRLPPPIDRLVPDLQAALLLGVSLGLAALFWAGTALLQTTPKEVMVPLVFEGLSPDRVVTGEMARARVTVVIRGTPEMLRRVGEDEIQARVDVSALELGPHVVEMGREDVRLPSSVELERVVPSSIQFTLEKKVQREMPLEPAFTGKPPRGLQVLSWSVDPPTTPVEGPESLLRQLRRVTTQPVPLEGRSQDFEAAVVPAPAEAELTVTAPQTHRLRVSVGELLAQRAITPVAVTVLRAGEGLTTDLAPSALTVMVEGPQSLVARLRPEDLVAEVDLQGLAASAKAYQLKPAVRLADPTLRSRVEVTSWIQKFVTVTVRTRAAGEGGGA